MTGAVGRRRHHRSVEGGEQRMGQRMCGYAHGQAVEAGEREIGDGAVGRFGQHQRQWARPKMGRQLLGGSVETAEQPSVLGVGDMGNKRIEGGPSFGGI
jgi:hypothetical protein